MKQTFKKTLALTLAASTLLSSSPLTQAYANEQTNEFWREPSNFWFVAEPFEATKQATEQVVTQMMEALSLSGVTVALVDAQEGYTWFSGFGYADSVAERLIDEYAVFNVASISKTVTTVAIMQLVEAGLVDLDAPVTTYLPEFSLQTTFLGEGNSDDITVRMLLTHTSGIFPDVMGYGALTIGQADASFLNNFVENISKYPLASVPNTTATYSNSAFNILGLIVASFVNETNPFDDFVAYTNENIFVPMGMTGSSFEINDDLLPILANPYVSAGVPDVVMSYNPAPAGGLWTNAHDMARFMEMMLTGGQLEGTQILSAESVSQMHTIHDFDNFDDMLSFGLGTMRRVDPLSGVVTYGHGGTMIHYHSDMVWDVASGLGVFVSTNSITGISAATPIANTILSSAILEKTGQAIETIAIIEDLEATPISLSREELEHLEGLFVAQSTYYEIAATDTGVLEMKTTTQLVDENISELVPLSDGSFLDEAGMRWTPREVDGELWFSLGAPGVFNFSRRVADADFVSLDEVAPYLGTFVPDLPEGQVSLIHTIQVTTDRAGRPFMYMFTIHGMFLVSPMLTPEGMGIDAYLSEAFGDDLVNYEYDVAGNAIAFNVQGVRFVRAN